MKRATFSIGLVAGAVLMFAQAASAQHDAEEYLHVPVNVSLFPGASIGDLMVAGTDLRVVNGVAFNIWAGRAARLEGVEFGGIWNAYTESVRGLQYAGVINTVGGDLQGAQFTGIVNLLGGDVQGAQFAGVANANRGSVSGAQFSGLANVVNGRVVGAQFSGVTNIVEQDVRGAQFAGVVNIAGGHVAGLQAAGVVNIAPTSSGVQLGVVNVSRENTGIPIGLISYVADVGLRFDLSGDETGMTTAAIRSGNRRFSNYVGLASRPFGDEEFRFAIMAGLGTEFPVTNRLFGAVEGVNYGLNSHRFDSYSNLSRLRMMAGVLVTPNFAVFGGPTFNVYASRDNDGSDLAPWTVYETKTSGTYVRMWPGFAFGLRFYSKR